MTPWGLALGASLGQPLAWTSGLGSGFATSGFIRIRMYVQDHRFKNSYYLCRMLLS